MVFSVLTVTYNSSQFVRDAIESVLASTFTDFELIIGDDCSTDNTWEIINEYHDPRIIKYRNETNLREYPNRNKALNLAKGEWVIFIDGDDLIYPHALSFIYEMIRKEDNIGMLLMRWYRNNMFFPILISPRDFYLEQYFGDGFLGTAFTNTVFSRKVLNDLGGLSNDHIYGDDYIRKKIALKNNMLVISDQLTFWRETPNQASQQGRHSFKNQVKIFDADFLFLDSAVELGVINSEEYKLAKKNLSRIIMKIIVKKIIKLRILEGFKYLNRYCSILVLSAKKKQIKSTFSDYSPSNILDFKESKKRLLNENVH